MDPYIIVLAGFGVVILLTAWLPMLLRELPLSLPIVCVGFGAAMFAIPDVPGTAYHPMDFLPVVERLTEFVLIISLMGAGLKIDRPFRWGRWHVTWRLLGIAMPLTMAALTLLGQTLLGLGLATALLLGAALAPTDPVLASDVQVGPPGQGKEDEVRFALTSEAGLNDGLAFPFVNLAIILALASQVGEPWLIDWLSFDVALKITVGIGVGYGVGWVLGWLTFHLPNRAKLSRTGDGFVALGITCLAYGMAEMARGYGFLAVFVAALALRSAERESDYHQKLHDFAEELERVLMMVLLVLFGAAMTGGALFRALTWEGAIFALLALFVVRPLSGWIGFAGAGCPPAERAVISFFGIRGIGTLYYLAYGMNHAPFERPDALWSTAGLTILISIVLHGMTVTPVMRRLDKRSRAIPGRANGEWRVSSPVRRTGDDNHPAGNVTSPVSGSAPNP